MGSARTPAKETPVHFSRRGEAEERLAESPLEASRPPLPGSKAKGPKPDEVVQRPFKLASKSMLPFGYGLVFGCAGLFMIYGVAANLGPEKTQLWLITAMNSLLIKIAVADPCKLAAVAALTQHAEHLASDAVATGLQAQDP